MDEGFIRYAEAVNTIQISKDHELIRPQYARGLEKIIIPGISKNESISHALHVLPCSPLQEDKIRRIYVPTKMNCTMMIEPDLLVMGCGRSHSILNLSELQNEDLENNTLTQDYVIKSFHWHLDEITALATIADGRKIASCATDGQIYLCDLTHISSSQYPTPISSHNLGPHYATSLKLHPNQNHLLSWTTDYGHLQFFDLRQSRLVASLFVLPKLINDHAHHNMDCILGFDDGMVQVIDVRCMMPKKSFREDALSTITQLDVVSASKPFSQHQEKGDLLLLYGSGLLAYDARAFCTSVNHPKRAFVFPSMRNEKFYGMAPMLIIGARILRSCRTSPRQMTWPPRRLDLRGL